MWIEDGIQDIRIVCWQRDDDRTLTLRAAVIDAARKYGRHSRAGVVRDPVSLDFLLEDSPKKDQITALLGAQARRLKVPDAIASREQMLDAQQAISDLSPRWQKALDNSIRRKHQSNGMEQAASKAKQRVRKLCA